MLKFSIINSKIKCKICSNLTIQLPEVNLVSLLLTLNVFDTLFYCFFADFEHVNGGWNTYCLNLNLSMLFRVRSRNPVTFKTDLRVTSVNNSFQSFPIFCHKELHLTCCIEIESNIVTWSTKILKGVGGTPPSSYDQLQSWFFAINEGFGI